MICVAHDSRQVVKEGQEVQVRVVEVNTEANNLTLSMLDPSSAKAEVARSADNSEEGGEDNYGGMIAAYHL